MKHPFHLKSGVPPGHLGFQFIYNAWWIYLEFIGKCVFFSISNFCLGATEVNYWRLRKLWDRSFEFSGYLGALVKGYRVSLRRNGQKHSTSSKTLKQLYWNSPTLYSKGYTGGAPLMFHYPLLKILNSRLPGSPPDFKWQGW